MSKKKDKVSIFSFNATPQDFVVDDFVEIENILAEKAKKIPGINDLKINGPMSVEGLNNKSKRGTINFSEGKNVVKDLGLSPSVIIAYVYASGGISVGSASIEDGELKESCVSAYKYSYNAGTSENPDWKESMSFDMSPSRLFRVDSILGRLRSIDSDGFTFDSNGGSGFMTFICF